MEKIPPPALKDTVGVISKKANLTTSDVVPRRTVPPQPSGLLFSQQADGLGTRKRTRGQLTREKSPDVGEFHEWEENQVTPKETWPAPKMAAWPV